MKRRPRPVPGSSTTIETQRPTAVPSASEASVASLFPSSASVTENVASSVVETDTSAIQHAKRGKGKEKRRHSKTNSSVEHHSLKPSVSSLHHGKKGKKKRKHSVTNTVVDQSSHVAPTSTPHSHGKSTKKNRVHDLSTDQYSVDTSSSIFAIPDTKSERGRESNDSKITQSQTTPHLDFKRHKHGHHHHHRHHHRQHPPLPDPSQEFSKSVLFTDLQSLFDEYDKLPISLDSNASIMESGKELSTDVLPYDYYDPFGPQAQVSQTNLIEAIGKPFNPNLAKYLPPPGFEFQVARNASEVRLNQLPILCDLDPKKIDNFRRKLVLLAWLIGGCAVAYFILLICVASISTPMEYIMFFLDGNFFCKAAYILGALQPFVVAPFCKYALLNLKHIRTYLIRVPPSLFLPVSVVLCSVTFLLGTLTDRGRMGSFLLLRMKQYHKHERAFLAQLGQETWNGIQEAFSCCGFKSFRDWLHHNQTHLPKSCCQDSTGHPCVPSSPNLHRDGCKSPYKSLNIFLGAMFIFIGLATTFLEILSLVFMRRLWAYIGKELYDERSALSIIGGKFCSLCDIPDSDDEIEKTKDEDEQETLSYDMFTKVEEDELPKHHKLPELIADTDDDIADSDASSLESSLVRLSTAESLQNRITITETDNEQTDFA